MWLKCDAIYSAWGVLCVYVCVCVCWSVWLTLAGHRLILLSKIITNPWTCMESVYLWSFGEWSSGLCVNVGASEKSLVCSQQPAASQNAQKKDDDDDDDDGINIIESIKRNIQTVQIYFHWMNEIWAVGTFFIFALPHTTSLFVIRVRCTVECVCMFGPRQEGIRAAHSTSANCRCNWNLLSVCVCVCICCSLDDCVLFHRIWPHNIGFAQKYPRSSMKRTK